MRHEAWDMVVLRSLVFNVLFYAALIALMVLGLPILFCGPTRVRHMATLWGRQSLWLVRVVCGMRIEVRGLENVPPGGCIVAPKHQSIWEVFALTTVFPDFTFVLKRELTLIPLFGWYLVRSGQIAVDRAKGRAALTQAARKGREVLGNGKQLVLFPEGTRRLLGAPPDYKVGVAYIYAVNAVPCVPVALNSGLFWPRHGFIRRPGTIVVDILPAIPPGLRAAEFLPLLRDRVEAACDRLNAEAMDRDPDLARAVPAMQAPLPT